MFLFFWLRFVVVVTMEAFLVALIDEKIFQEGEAALSDHVALRVDPGQRDEQVEEVFEGYEGRRETSDSLQDFGVDCDADLVFIALE